MDSSAPSIYFVPRFHVNFYHSYRSDTPDEQGFGKDIRIIRGILDDLDRLSSSGIVVSCAWDFDNAFSLAQMIPTHAPDILERIRQRVEEGIDEIHLMSWNNGLLSAHTKEEFSLAIAWALQNRDTSGILDLFGSCAPIVRPQECMIVPSQMEGYATLGIDTLSLYYSAIPFNGFGAFIPPLPLAQRYNPLIVKNNDTQTSMRLLPAINQGDLVEFGFSLRRMVKHMRREQQGLRDPVDLILLLDMDADDTFWAGMAPKGLKGLVPSFAGFERLVGSIADLPYIRFTRASDYLASHEAQQTVTIGQDLADGAFDGFASWAEKWDNHDLWAKVGEARSLWQQAKERVITSHHLPAASSEDFYTWSGVLPAELQEMAQKAIATRLRTLSTTHFGLSAPVMNTHRLEVAHQSADEAIEETQRFLSAVKAITAPVVLPAPQVPHYQGVSSTATHNTNGRVIIESDGSVFTIESPWVTYAKRRQVSQDVVVKERTSSGTIVLPGGCAAVVWQRTVTVDTETGTLIVSVDVQYPDTEHSAYSKAKALHLGRSWDGRWSEVAPCEITLFDDLPLSQTVTVYKQDFSGQTSSYDLDYWGKNKTLASINNHVTPSWLALSDGSRGLLIAQDCTKMHGFAAIPLRQTIKRGRQRISANPLGTYWGPQYHYPLARNGWGRLAAMLTAEHLFASAPSWAGKRAAFSLLLAPYQGSHPSKGLCSLAEYWSQEGRLP
ncbi:MAG: hypothetical protein M0Q37_11435 [Sphaerochaeta sp.]|nr:hypothetical protein [Sphaerochaeta sp.]